MSPYPSRDVRPAPLSTLFWFIIINFYVAIPFQKCWTHSIVCIVLLHWYELTSLPFQTEVSYQVLSVLNWVHYYWLMSLPFQRCRTVLSVSLWLINHNPSEVSDCIVCITLVDLPFQRCRTVLSVSLWVSIVTTLPEVSEPFSCLRYSVWWKLLKTLHVEGSKVLRQLHSAWTLAPSSSVFFFIFFIFFFSFFLSSSCFVIMNCSSL